MEDLQLLEELSIKSQLTESQLLMRVHQKPTFRLDFIMERDGPAVDCDWNNIYMSNGASEGVR